MELWISERLKEEYLCTPIDMTAGINNPNTSTYVSLKTFSQIFLHVHFYLKCIIPH